MLLRRLKRVKANKLPDIILIDGGLSQLNIALKVFDKHLPHPPLVLSIAKGANRVRATETILSKKGILEMPKESSGYLFLQQVRDESHRFAITSNRKKKNKAIKYSLLDKVHGLGPQKKRSLLNHFKSLKLMKTASLDEVCKVNGISIKLALEIQKALSKK